MQLECLLNPKQRTILIVDDCGDDRHLMELAFVKLGFPLIIRCVHSGNEALRYLRGEGSYSKRDLNPIPKYIITDLKMPDGDGFQLLSELKQNPHWRAIPTIIMSSSQDADDVKKAFLLGANGMFVKRQAFGELVHLIQTLQEYWDLSEMPEKDQGGRLLPTESKGKLGADIPEN